MLKRDETIVVDYKCARPRCTKTARYCVVWRQTPLDPWIRLRLCPEHYDRYRQGDKKYAPTTQPGLVFDSKDAKKYGG